MYVVFDYVLKIQHKKENVEFEKKQIEIEKEYYRDIMGRHEELAKIAHDFENKLFGIKSLMIQDIEKAHEMIDEICKIVKEENLPRVGIECIDALINSKIKNAKKVFADIKVQSYILGGIQIDSIDLCIIIGNLLDNAIEATSFVENKEILLKIKTHNSFLSITVKNECNSLVMLKDYKTIKKNKLLHGYGLSNVKETVEKYDGTINYGVKENQFIVNIVMNNI